MSVDIGRWLARACLAAALALAAYGGVAFFSGASDVWPALGRIGSTAIVGGLLATSISLGVRAARWQLIFRRLGHRLPALFQLRVYLSGLALSSTPGKLGETSRSLLLRSRGVTYADSLAAFVCDRLADVIGVAALGAAAAALAGSRQPLLESIALFSFAGSLVLARLLRSRAGAIWLASPRRWAAMAAGPAAAWAGLWNGSSVGVYLAMAVLAHGITGLVFAAFVAQVHAGLGWAPCLAIFVNATLIGAASMVPGGLVTMDAALVIQLQAAGVPAGAALAASIATRVCTLLFAWAVGLGALLSFSRSAAP